MRRVKIAIIGAGTAGLSALDAVRETTDDVVLIEGHQWGTTCARTGCMPSKLLIAAARSARAARGAETFGVKASPTVDGRSVLERVRRLRDDFVEGVLENVRDLPDGMAIEGEVRFEGAGRLDVGGEVLEAERIIIATGSQAFVPDELEEGTGGRYMTIADIFERDDLPESLLIFGAGVIGSEVAQAMTDLGVRVRVLSKGGSIGFLSDPRVNERARAIFASEYSLDTEVDLGEMGWEGDRFRCQFKDGGDWHEESFAAVLVATGRKPRLDGLDLGKAGIDMADGGPDFDSETRQIKGTDTHPVFIAGDADGERMVLPKATWSGKAAGLHAAAFPQKPGFSPPAPLGIAFTEPSMAQVGQRWQALADRQDVIIGEADFSDQGRSRCEDRNRGLLRIYAEQATGRILGAEAIAPDAEHWMHLLAWGMQAKLSVHTMADMPVYHPVTEEGLRTALRHAAADCGTASF